SLLLVIAHWVHRRPRRSTRCPYTTLFRSALLAGRAAADTLSPPMAKNGSSKGLTYAAAGVDIDAGDEVVHRIERHVRRTYGPRRSEEHTSELQSRENFVCRLLLEKKKNKK